MKRHKSNLELAYYKEMWNLDVQLARIIATHLREFLNALKTQDGRCPGVFTEGGCSVEEGHRMWLNTIRKMIYAFEEYRNSGIGLVPEEKQERVEEGMRLFIKHYRDLWI